MEVITKDDIRNYFTEWRNVRSDKRLSRACLAIMDTIQDQKFEDIYFSYNTWAEKVGIEKRQAIRCMKKLQELGYIQIMQKPDAKNTDTVHVIVKEDLRKPLRDDKEEDAGIGSLITKAEFDQDQNWMRMGVMTDTRE